MAVATTLAQCLRISSAASETSSTEESTHTHISAGIIIYFLPICRKWYVFYRSLPFHQNKCSITSFYARVGRLRYLLCVMYGIGVSVCTCSMRFTHSLVQCGSKATFHVDFTLAEAKYSKASSTCVQCIL